MEEKLEIRKPYTPGLLEISGIALRAPVYFLLYLAIILGLGVLISVVGGLGDKILINFSNSAKLTFDHPIPYWIGGHFIHFIKALLWFFVIYIGMRVAINFLNISLSVSRNMVLGVGIFVLALVLNLFIPSGAFFPLWVPICLLTIESFIWITLKTKVPAIALREFSSMLLTPMGYVFILAFSFLLFILYNGAKEVLSELTPQNPLSLSPLGAFFSGTAIGIGLMILIPAITMKLIAEEKGSGTEEVLFTLPIKEWHVAFGKFLGSFAYYALVWIISLVQIYLISHLGRLDLGQIWATYTAIMVMGAGFIAMGLFVSCLFKNQLPAFIVTFVGMLICTLYIFMKGKTGDGHEGLASVLQYLSIETHLGWATKGLLDSRTIFLFLSAGAVFLFLAVRVLEVKRWGALGLKEKYNEWKLIFVVVSFLLMIFLPLALSVYSGLQKIKIILLMIGMTIIFLAVISRVYNHGFSGTLVFGANVVAASIAVIMIAIMFNYLAYQYHTSIDWSYNGIFSLNQKTKDVLLDTIPDGEYVKAIATIGYTPIPPDEMAVLDNDRYQILNIQFMKFNENLNQPGNVKFQYEFVNPFTQRDRKSEIINKYGVSGSRELIIVYRDRYYVIPDKDLFSLKLEMSKIQRLRFMWQRGYEQGLWGPPPSTDEEIYNQLKDQAPPDMMSVYPGEKMEEAITNGIIQAVKGSGDRVYFTQTHNERLIQSREAEEGKKVEENPDTTAFYLRDILRRHNLDVKPLYADLSKEEIPKDCGVLIIMGPKDKFSADEVKELDKYMEKSGRIIVLLEPESDGGLQSFLAEHGIKTEANVATTFQMDRYARQPMPVHVVVLKDSDFERGHFKLTELFTPQRTQDMTKPIPDSPYAFKRVRSVEFDQTKSDNLKGLEFFKVPERYMAKPAGKEDEEVTKETKNAPYGFAVAVQPKADYIWEFLDEIQHILKEKLQEEKEGLDQGLELLSRFTKITSFEARKRAYREIDETLRESNIPHDKVVDILKNLKETLEKEKDEKKFKKPIETIEKMNKSLGTIKDTYEDISSSLVQIRGSYQDLSATHFKVVELEKVIKKLEEETGNLSSLLSSLREDIGPAGARWRLVTFGDTTFTSDEKCEEARSLPPPPWVYIGNNRVVISIFLRYLINRVDRVKIKTQEPLLFTDIKDKEEISNFTQNFINFIPGILAFVIGVLVWLARRSY